MADIVWPPSACRISNCVDGSAQAWNVNGTYLVYSHQNCVVNLRLQDSSIQAVRDVIHTIIHSQTRVICQMRGSRRNEDCCTQCLGIDGVFVSGCVGS